MAQKSHDELIDEIRLLRAQLAARATGRNCLDTRLTPCVAQQRLAGILTISEDAIIAADSQHRITLFNQGAERIFQYSANEVLGKPMHILLPERLRERHMELLEAFLAAGRHPERLGMQGEMWGRRKDGTEFPAEVSASQVAVGSQVTITVILRDVTERQRVQEALSQARDQALEASRIKSAFLANMSHEIRTPMNGIIGMLELLMATPLSEVQREYAQVVYDSAQALLTLINDILDYSKIEANKLDLEIIDFEPLDLVEGVAELLAAKAREKGLSLMTYVDPRVPTTLRGDPVRLRQILLNLGDNAIKFTEQGEVVINATLAGQEDDMAVVHFSVRDTGIGIQPDLQGALFEPFVQADGTTTRRFGGTGLGLSISKRLVEQMGGQIGVESEPGEGTLFWFRVPFVYSQAQRYSPVEVGDLGNVRVLVVDDNATACRILREYLGSWGIQSDAVHTSSDALRMLQEAADKNSPYDIAIIDLRMPVTDGMQLAAAIRSNPALMRTRLILLTAFDAHGQGEQAMRHGFSAYMTKPVKQSHLFDCIVNLLSQDHPELISGFAPTQKQVATASNGSGKKSVCGGRVLVVEDNPVNRKVVTLQLESLGYDVDSVTNGAEAVEAVRAHRYDLVFMDCQMPEMDGFRATQIIRKAEATTGRHIPIVALTANAMQGDREKCIGAGMDDYLSKPVSTADLRDVLERWLPPSQQDKGEGEQPPVAPEREAGESKVDAGVASEDGDAWVDVDELLATYGPERSRVARILELYATTSAETVEGLHEAIRGRCLDRAKALAHELKGSSNMIGAYRMGEQSLAVEQATREEDWNKIEEAFAGLRQVYAETEAHIGRVLNSWAKED